MNFKCSQIPPCLLFKLSTVPPPSPPTAASIVLVAADSGVGWRAESSCETQTQTQVASGGGAVDVRLCWQVRSPLRGKCLRSPSVHDNGRRNGEARIICLQRLLPWATESCHGPLPPAPRFLCLTF